MTIQMIVHLLQQVLIALLIQNHLFNMYRGGNGFVKKKKQQLRKPTAAGQDVKDLDSNDTEKDAKSSNKINRCDSNKKITKR